MLAKAANDARNSPDLANSLVSGVERQEILDCLIIGVCLES